MRHSVCNVILVMLLINRPSTSSRSLNAWRDDIWGFNYHTPAYIQHKATALEWLLLPFHDPFYSYRQGIRHWIRLETLLVSVICHRKKLTLCDSLCFQMSTAEPTGHVICYTVLPRSQQSTSDSKFVLWGKCDTCYGCVCKPV